MANPPSTVNENESSVRDQGDRTKELSQEENEVEVKMPEGRTVLDNEKNGVNVMKCEQKSVKDSKKNSMTGDEEALAVMVTVPPDGGWGWVVVAASFVANFIVDGILYCYGDFLPVIKNDFHETSAKVSIPGSLLAGFYLMTGPFVSVLANKFGFRKVVMVGSVFAAIAFALSSLAMNIEYLIFTYGVLGGIGFGMIYSPSIVTVGYYFERWRGIATGIAVCGSGIGTFALSPLNNIFIKAVGWQNTFLIQAGIILLCIICGAMYRPIKPVKIALDENLEESEDEKAEELSRTKNCHGEKTKKFDSFSRAKSHKPPTAAEILHIVGRPTSFETTTSKLSKSSQSLNVHHIGPRYSAEFEKNEKRLSVPNYVDHSGFHGHHKSSKGRSLSHMIDFGRRKRTSSEVSSTLSQGVECIISSRRGTITQVEDRLNIPIQRDDAFFTGSLLRLPQFKPERDSISYTLSVTRIPIQEENKFSCVAFLKSIADLFDFSLLLSPSFDLLLLSGFLTMVGYFTPFSYLKDRAIEEGGWTDEETAWLLSTIGITNTVGRVLSGFVSSHPKMDATLMNNIALMIAGIATAVSGLSLALPYQYAYCAIFGFAMATFASLRTIIVVDLLGLENLNNAFGILLFVQGLGSALGSPVAGAIREATADYSASFYFSGVLIAFSGLCLFPLKAVNRWEKKRQNNKDLEKTKSDKY